VLFALPTKFASVRMLACTHSSTVADGGGGAGGMPQGGGMGGGMDF